MNLQDILTIYEYNYWANKRILAASAKGYRETIPCACIFSVWRIARHDCPHPRCGIWLADVLPAEQLVRAGIESGGVSNHRFRSRTSKSRRKGNARLSRHSKRQRSERSQALQQRKRRAA